jgi:hypothetical protein
MSNVTAAPETRRAFQVCIDDQPFEVRDPIITSRQVLDLAGKRPASDYVVLQYLPDGLLEHLRLEETTDLRVKGVERFITFESDRVFRFTLDEREFSWGAPRISGAKLKELAGVDPAKFDVWQEARKSDDRLIGDKEEANLDEKGTERFFTAAKTTTEG